MASDNNPGAQLAAAAVSAPANSSPTQQAAQPSAPTPSVGTPATQNDQRCLWEACSERFPGPEALYVSLGKEIIESLASRSKPRLEH